MISLDETFARDAHALLLVALHAAPFAPSAALTPPSAVRSRRYAFPSFPNEMASELGVEPCIVKRMGTVPRSRSALSRAFQFFGAKKLDIVIGEVAGKAMTASPPTHVAAFAPCV